MSAKCPLLTSFLVYDSQLQQQSVQATDTIEARARDRLSGSDCPTSLSAARTTNIHRLVQSAGAGCTLRLPATSGVSPFGPAGVATDIKCTTRGGDLRRSVHCGDESNWRQLVKQSARKQAWCALFIVRSLHTPVISSSLQAGLILFITIPLALAVGRIRLPISIYVCLQPDPSTNPCFDERYE